MFVVFCLDVHRAKCRAGVYRDARHKPRVAGRRTRLPIDARYLFHQSTFRSKLWGMARRSETRSLVLGIDQNEAVRDNPAGSVLEPIDEWCLRPPDLEH